MALVAPLADRPVEGAHSLREYLEAKALKYVVIAHSRAVTAQEVAQRMHVPGHELAKTVVLRA